MRSATTGVDASRPPAKNQPRAAGALDRVIRALMGVAIVANVGYLAVLLLPGAPQPASVDIILTLTIEWFATAIFWIVAVQTRFARWDVTLAAIGITFNSLGETHYMLAMDETGYLPSPALADIGYLFYYPLTLAALVVLVRRQSRKATASVAFDSLIAVLGASAVLAVILSPLFEYAVTGGSFLEGAITAAYPLFDILLIAVIVAVSASPVLRMGPRWLFLVVGLLLFTGADIAYALLDYNDAYLGGTPLDVFWCAAVTFAAWWVIGVGQCEPQPRAKASMVRVLPIPALAVLAGLGVLVLGTQVTVPAVALVLAAATVALAAIPVMFRQAALARLIEGQEQVVERLKELDKSKSDIIGTVSHEMRTPLTSILGFLELVLDGSGGPIPGEAKDLLRVAERSARRLENLVGNMLMMARMEAGKAAPALAAVEVGPMLRRAALALRPLSASRGVGIDIDCDDLVIVEGDEGQLERVFTNVMENAVKFSPANGTVHVEVMVGVLHEGMRAVTITIADTGIGIPADELPRLFERFFRASTARENIVPGTGLGLSIVREIVQSHDGDIAVTSTVGEGTTFYITLPVSAATPTPSEPLAAQLAE
ncbi:HAMP domain-containing histidine kinase [Salinibacterium sp. SYSU T00001]|uniref:sensor histidine kinase n=1 Tax=Homoserinimonas sedimenticola TaxID=2986805 RepID=UPI002235869C|nr:HAMP domain-containing histidine kinase [Salinibacterium sedimenticola]MCW4384968.1 HAMP domain-containing histidine kinase [Salinibacterium sedimenticola]